MTTTTPRITPLRIKTRHLQLLSQVERDGSVLRAAESLGMSQSAASRLLSELERSIGVALLERHARGVTPTRAGEIVIRRAAAALSEIERAQRDVADLQRGGRIPLSIGSLLSPCSDYLPSALLALSKAEPDIAVQVHVDTSRTLVQGLLNARFDLVLARVQDASLQPELVVEPLVEETFTVVARPGHPLGRKRRLALSDLVEEPWVLPPVGTDLRARLDALCVQQGLPLLRSVVETISAPLMLNLLRLSGAITVLPTAFVRPYCAAGALSALRIDLGIRSENFGLLTRRQPVRSPALANALAVFRKAAIAAYPSALSGTRKFPA
jgi:DNA-binding transcriptional LysR family regulator